MTDIGATPTTTTGSRRQFLRDSGVLLAGATIAAPALGNVHVAGDEVLKIGLIGCGGRGTGRRRAGAERRPERQARRHGRCLSAIGSGTASTRFASEEAHRATRSTCRRAPLHRLRRLQASASPAASTWSCWPRRRISGRSTSRPPSRRASTSSPRSRCAVDAPGVRSVLEIVPTRPRRKNLSVVSGLCWRYDHGKRETMKRIHDGAIGDIVAMQCTYNTGTLWNRARTARAGATWNGSCATGSISPGCRATQRRAARPQPRQDGLGHEGPL